MSRVSETAHGDGKSECEGGPSFPNDSGVDREQESDARRELDEGVDGAQPLEERAPQQGGRSANLNVDEESARRDTLDGSLGHRDSLSSNFSSSHSSDELCKSHHLRPQEHELRQLQNQQQAQQQQADNKPKRNPYCSRCRNHGKSAQVKGHKRHCEYRDCQCEGCKLVECRQIVSAAQIKRRRYQKQDEECGRRIEVSPPVLTRTPSNDPATLIAKTLIGSSRHTSSVLPIAHKSPVDGLIPTPSTTATLAISPAVNPHHQLYSQLQPLHAVDRNGAPLAPSMAPYTQPNLSSIDHHIHQQQQPPPSVLAPPQQPLHSTHHPLSYKQDSPGARRVSHQVGGVSASSPFQMLHPLFQAAAATATTMNSNSSSSTTNNINDGRPPVNQPVDNSSHPHNNLTDVFEQLRLAEEIHQTFGLQAIYAWLKAEQFDIQRIRNLIEISRPSFNDLMDSKPTSDRRRSCPEGRDQAAVSGFGSSSSSNSTSSSESGSVGGCASLFISNNNAGASANTNTSTCAGLDQSQRQKGRHEPTNGRPSPSGQQHVACSAECQLQHRSINSSLASPPISAVVSSACPTTSDSFNSPLACHGRSGEAGATLARAHDRAHRALSALKSVPPVGAAADAGHSLSTVGGAGSFLWPALKLNEVHSSALMHPHLLPHFIHHHSFLAHQAQQQQQQHRFADLNSAQASSSIAAMLSANRRQSGRQLKRGASLPIGEKRRASDELASRREASNFGLSDDNDELVKPKNVNNDQERHEDGHYYASNISNGNHKTLDELALQLLSDNLKTSKTNNEMAEIDGRQAGGADDVLQRQEEFRIRTANRRHLDFDEHYDLDDTNSPHRSRWSGPFHFIQAADSQFGMIDSYVHRRTEPGWQEEIELCENLVRACNQMSPRPLFLIICGDLIDSLPGSEIGARQVVDFKRIFAKLNPQIPLVCVCGNHDIGDEPTPQTVADYRQRFGDDYFYFTKNDILFIVINSQFYQNRERVPELALAQDQWLENLLAKCKQFKYSFIFEHIPWFLERPDEDNDYFNIRKEVRLNWLQKFQAAGVTKVMCGHYHRNAGGWFQGMELVVTSAIGAQCGSDQSGVRIVKVLEDTIEHKYYAMQDIPLQIELKKGQS